MLFPIFFFLFFLVSSPSFLVKESQEKITRIPNKMKAEVFLFNQTFNISSQKTIVFCFSFFFTEYAPFH